MPTPRARYPVLRPYFARREGRLGVVDSLLVAVKLEGGRTRDSMMQRQDFRIVNNFWPTWRLNQSARRNDECWTNAMRAGNVMPNRAFCDLLPPRSRLQGWWELGKKDGTALSGLTRSLYTAAGSEPNIDQTNRKWFVGSRESAALNPEYLNGCRSTLDYFRCYSAGPVGTATLNPLAFHSASKAIMLSTVAKIVSSHVV